MIVSLRAQVGVCQQANVCQDYNIFRFRKVEEAHSKESNASAFRVIMVKPLVPEQPETTCSFSVMTNRK